MVDWIDAVRMRPGMYFGDVDTPQAMETVVGELLRNVLGRHLSSEPGHIDVELGPEGHIVVDDDGAGIEIAPAAGGIPVVEWVMTVSTMGIEQKGDRPYPHLGWGMGLAPVCAVSAEVVVDLFRGDGHYRAVFSRGRTMKSLHRLGDTQRRGTRIDVQLDDEIFRRLEWPTGLIEEQLRVLPSLIPGLTTSLRIHERFGPDADLGALVERIHARSRGSEAKARLHPSPIVGCASEREGRADVRCCGAAARRTRSR